MAEQKCPKCDGETRKHGFKPLRNRYVQQYQCKTCGFVFHKGEAKTDRRIKI